MVDLEKILFLILILNCTLLLLLFIVSGVYMGYNTYVGERVCSDNGYDSVNTWDSVRGVKYYECCIDSIGEDICGKWVKKQ